MLTDNGVIGHADRGERGRAHVHLPHHRRSTRRTSLAGTITHSGGLQFAAGGKKLRVQDFVIDTREACSPPVSGTRPDRLLDLNLRNAHISKGKTQIVVSGVHASLTARPPRR